MEGEDNQASPFVGEWIWKTISILKVKCFLWQCYHNGIPVQATLAYRGMDISPSCLICNDAPETIIHVLRDCPFAKWFWNSFPQPMQASLFYGSRLADWMRLNCRSTKVSLCSGINWGVVFPFGIWGLWLYGNSIIFDRERPQNDLKREVMAKAIEFVFLGANDRLGGHHTTIKINWHRPP